MRAMRTVADRLKYLRGLAGLTQDGLSALAGVSRGAVGNWERGGGIARDSAQVVAAALDVSLDWLLEGRGEPPTEISAIRRAGTLGGGPNVEGTLTPTRIALATPAGIVAAGLWFEDDSMDAPHFEPQAVVPTRFGGLEQFAYRVSGDSMNLICPDGSYIIAVEYWKARAFPTDGDYVVVLRRDGQRIERTLKQVVVTPTQFRLEARSSNPKWANTAIVIDRERFQGASDSSVEIVGLAISFQMSLIR